MFSWLQYLFLGKEDNDVCHYFSNELFALKSLNKINTGVTNIFHQTLSFSPWNSLGEGINDGLMDFLFTLQHVLQRIWKGPWAFSFVVA